MKVLINGYNINYDVDGSGKNVILLHGWLCNKDTMKPLYNHLIKKFRVYNVDVLGFGKSDLPKYDLNSDDFGNFLNEFIKTLNIENPTLIGHSNGGRIIINLAGRRLCKINKIVLIDSAGIKPKRSLKYHIKTFTYKLVKMIANVTNNKYFNNLKNKMYEKSASDDYKNTPEVLKKTMSTIINEDLTSILKNIEAPTLLIWGEKDTATPLRDATILEKNIPDCGKVVYKNAGHFSYLDNLGEVLIVLDKFLDD